MKRTAVVVELNQVTAAEQSARLQTVPVPLHSITFRHPRQGYNKDVSGLPAAQLAVSLEMLATSTDTLQVGPP